jgi:hypothetical protein
MKNPITKYAVYCDVFFIDANGEPGRENDAQGAHLFPTKKAAEAAAKKAAQNLGNGESDLENFEIIPVVCEFQFGSIEVKADATPKWRHAKQGGSNTWILDNAPDGFFVSVSSDFGSYAIDLDYDSQDADSGFCTTFTVDNMAQPQEIVDGAPKQLLDQVQDWLEQIKKDGYKEPTKAPSFKGVTWK